MAEPTPEEYVDWLNETGDEYVDYLNSLSGDA